MSFPETLKKKLSGAVLRVEDLQASLIDIGSHYNFQATWSNDIKLELLVIVLPDRLHVVAPQGSKNPCSQIISQSYSSIAWSPARQGCSSVLLAARGNSIFAISVDDDGILATLAEVIADKKGLPV